MSPKSKKRIKKIKAGMFPFTVLFLLVVAGLSAVFFVLPPEKTIVRAGDNWNLYQTIDDASDKLNEVTVSPDGNHFAFMSIDTSNELSLKLSEK